MRSFPAMQDMARTAEDKAKDSPMGLVTPAVSDLPDYDYGLNISLNQESLDKLDLEDQVNVGDYLHIQAFAKVTSINQPPGANKPDRVCFVMTHICAEDEDNESEDEA